MKTIYTVPNTEITRLDAGMLMDGMGSTSPGGHAQNAPSRTVLISGPHSKVF